MARIEREAARMGVLVEDLLLLARLDEGATASRTRFDLSALATRAAEDARAADPGREIAVVSDGPVEIETDERRVRQVVDNLLANARAHTPDGTRTAVRVARADGGVVLEVADDGPGIAPEDRDRVFERFYRADASRSRAAGGGAGLGLAIAAEIASAHGGSLELVAAERGATFRMTLPADDAGAPQDASAPDGP
jgi:two-component system OmpR family sensor kinase